MGPALPPGSRHRPKKPPEPACAKPSIGTDCTARAPIVDQLNEAASLMLVARDRLRTDSGGAIVSGGAGDALDF